MEKILTVSIAAYNVEQYLDECLKPFIQSEVLEKCEVLIIDDGATDHTDEIAKKYVDQYPDTFKLIQKQNGGWGSTINTGMRLATGKYFKQLDGDDYFSKENLLGFITALEGCDCDMIITPFITFDSVSGNVLRVVDITNSEKVEYNKSFLANDFSEKFIIEMHLCTFKTSLLKQNRIHVTEHAFYTDVEFVIKVFSKVKSIICFPMTVYCYRVARDGQSISISGIRKHYHEHRRILQKSLEFVNHLPENDNKRILKNRVNCMVRTQYFFYLCLEPNREHKKEIRDFDKWLKKKYPCNYHTNVKKINLLRLSQFTLYRIICLVTKKQFE